MVMDASWLGLHYNGSGGKFALNSENTPTIADLYRVPGQAELVRGRIVRMPPVGGFHAYAIGAVIDSLREYAQRTRRGHPLGSTVGFVVDLPHRKSFCPDVAYHVGPMTMKFID